MPLDGSAWPTRVSAADFAWDPAWSPDGSRIAFLRRVSRFEREIYTVPASGGPERKVAVGGVGVSWSPDGKWLALAEVAQPKEPSGIYLLMVEQNDKRNIVRIIKN